MLSSAIYYYPSLPGVHHSWLGLRMVRASMCNFYTMMEACQRRLFYHNVFCFLMLLKAILSPLLSWYRVNISSDIPQCHCSWRLCGVSKSVLFFRLEKTRSYTQRLVPVCNWLDFLAPASLSHLQPCQRMQEPSSRGISQLWRPPFSFRYHLMSLYRAPICKSTTVTKTLRSPIHALLFAQPINILCLLISTTKRSSLFRGSLYRRMFSIRLFYIFDCSVSCFNWQFEFKRIPLLWYPEKQVSQQFRFAI